MKKKLKGASNESRGAKVIHGEEAWWYENKKSIDVYVHVMGTTLSCRIRRADIEDWLRRTEGK